MGWLLVLMVTAAISVFLPGKTGASAPPRSAEPSSSPPRPRGRPKKKVESPAAPVTPPAKPTRTPMTPEARAIWKAKMDKARADKKAAKANA